MILNGKDVSDEEFFNRIVPIDNNFKKYMVNFIIPEAVAFYLKDCFYKDFYVILLYIIILILHLICCVVIKNQ